MLTTASKSFWPLLPYSPSAGIYISPPESILLPEMPPVLLSLKIETGVASRAEIAAQTGIHIQLGLSYTPSAPYCQPLVRPVDWSGSEFVCLPLSSPSACWMLESDGIFRSLQLHTPGLPNRFSRNNGVMEPASGETVFSI